VKFHEKLRELKGSMSEAALAKGTDCRAFAACDDVVDEPMGNDGEPKSKRLPPSTLPGGTRELKKPASGSRKPRKK
jgi:hypothetical protein